MLYVSVFLNIEDAICLIMFFGSFLRPFTGDLAACNLVGLRPAEIFLSLFVVWWCAGIEAVVGGGRSGHLGLDTVL